MKIIVFSDSHTDVDIMVSVTTKEMPDMLLHLGDHLRDAMQLQDYFPGIALFAVPGNTDFSRDGVSERLFNVEDVPLYMTHGHLHRVKNTLSAIRRAGAQLGARVVLFGHTHVPLLEYENGMYLMNPGCVGRFANNARASTYGVIQTSPNDIRCDIKTV